MGINNLGAVSWSAGLMHLPLVLLPPHSGGPPLRDLGVTLVCPQGVVGIACLGERSTRPETCVRQHRLGKYLRR